jgi:phosphoenolpyruvate carboxylase
VTHYPDEPYRLRFGSIAERLRQTRHHLVDGRGRGSGYASPAELLDEIVELQECLVEDGLPRVAYGEVQALRWQVETFGFHALSLEVRQHSEVHRATVEALAGTADGDEREAERIQVGDGVSAREVLETFRAIADIQARFGAEACRRYIISFTPATGRLRRHGPGATSGLDPQPRHRAPPRDRGRAGGRIACSMHSCDAIYRDQVRARGATRRSCWAIPTHQESGAFAAAWLLHGAGQARRGSLPPRRAATLFHGRGGAIGRGGGPMSRAILASAPHSLGGHLKLTEQGEVVANRYADRDIALRHLEQLTNAVLVASSRAHEQQAKAAQSRGQATLEEIAERSARTYRALVWETLPSRAFYIAATPSRSSPSWRSGARPAARGAAR